MRRSPFAHRRAKGWQRDRYPTRRIGLHLPVDSGLFTGQRLSDVIGMRRPLEGVAEMPLVARKTSEIVPVADPF